MSYQPTVNGNHRPTNNNGYNTGPLGAGSHVVKPGDCMLSIAYEHGFFWETLWKLPVNRDLRLARKTPGQLVAGDRVTVPEREIKEVPASTDARHYYVKRGVPAKVRLVVEYDDMPVSNADYVLVMGGSTQRGTTDPQGLLTAFIPPNVSQGTLDINGLHFELQLGALDPHSEDLGIQLRLANLGFYRGALDGLIGPQTRAAIADFQARTNLPSTGQLDDATRKMLLHRHDETHEKLPQFQPVQPDPPAQQAAAQNG
jgi:hypothetical protein